MLYGTFDHPQLIHYPQLQKDITSYIETGTFQKPHYSFIERRTTHYTTVDDTCDYMIVEWLYTTQQLATHFPQSLTIFVHSHTEELIFRRIIRDQKRVKEPTHTIIANIAKAFPMWNIYGKSQEKNSDILIHNDYEILNTQGNTITHTPCTHPQDHNKKESETELFSTHFIYNDESEDNGNIILSEHYKTQDGLLSHISIAHDKTINDQQHKNISIDIYQPGQVTPMHLLLQTAGLTYQETYTTHQKTYKKNNEENDKEMETITQKTSHNQVSYYHTSIQKPEAE